MNTAVSDGRSGGTCEQISIPSYFSPKNVKPFYKNFRRMITL